MVGISQNYGGFYAVPQIVLGNRFYTAYGSYRHKDRSLYGTMWRVQKPSSCLGGGIGGQQIKLHGTGLLGIALFNIEIELQYF